MTAAWPQFRLKVLKKVLKHDFIVSPEVRLQLPSVAMDHFASGLNADLLDHGQHRRGSLRIAGAVCELHTDLDLVNPVALERHNAGIIGGSDVPRVFVHRGHVKVVLKDGIDGGLPALFVLVSKVLADGQLAPDRIAYFKARLEGVRDIVGTESNRAGQRQTKQNGGGLLKCAHGQKYNTIRQ